MRVTVVCLFSDTGHQIPVVEQAKFLGLIFDKKTYFCASPALLEAKLYEGSLPVESGCTCQVGSFISFIDLVHVGLR